MAEVVRRHVVAQVAYTRVEAVSNAGRTEERDTVGGFPVASGPADPLGREGGDMSQGRNSGR